MGNAQILVVEDEAIVAKSIQAELQHIGYDVPATAASGEEAIQKAEAQRPDLVLMDIVLRGDMDGIEAAHHIRRRFDIPIVYLTAYEDDETLGRAKMTEPFGYLVKPFEEKELHSTIEMALYKHRVEQQIKATEAWLSTTLQSIADGVVATDARLSVRLLNPSAVALTGWPREAALGKDLSEVCHVYHADSPTVLESLATQAIRHGASLPLPDDVLLVDRDGRETPVEGNLAPIRDDEGNLSGIVLVFRNVSERRQLEQVRRQNEEHRRQAEKMQAVSRLAGGVAHDFNNLLTAILGNTSLARTRLPEDHPSAELLVAAEAATERAAQRVKQLLSVSGNACARLKSANLTACLAELERELGRSAVPGVAVVFRLADGLWTVQADWPQLREALVNLCLNAQEAMPGGGRLTLDTANVTIGADHIHEQPQARPGEYVRLRVQDTGRGVAPDLVSRIFEPFFTTKQPIPGRGLGLALAHGIVEQHDGWIECSGAVGGGACFALYLPRYSHPLVPPPAPLPLPREQNGATTILLADDEPLLRDLGRTILEGQGYHVLLAQDGAEAVEIFQRQRYLIDLVVLDLTMPRLSGQDACRQMLAIDPGVRVLFASGYFAEESASEDNVLGFLHKPYRHEELVRTVHAALEQVQVPRRDVLLMLVKRLEQAVDVDWVGREKAWVERVVLVLDRVERAMQQLAVADTSDEMTDAGAGSDASRARRFDGLRGRYVVFLEQAGELKRELQRMAQVLGNLGPTERGAPAGPALEPVAVDIGAIRKRIAVFRKDLEHHRQEEIHLVMESVTTDLGGGD